MIVSPDLDERQRREVRAVSLLMVEGRLQRANNTVNIIASRLRQIGDAAFPDASEEPPDDPVRQRQEADPCMIELVRATDRLATEEVIDLSRITPQAHTYR